MKLDEKEIFAIGLKFTILFFALAKEYKSFLNVLMGFIYSHQTILKAMEKFNVLSAEELGKINEELSKAVDAGLEKNMQLIEVLRQQMDETNE
jgi:DNA-directed RNA polymerase subunit F